MPYQNDMSTLADIVSPAAAADFAGQQNQMELQKQSLENQLKAGTLQADIEKPQLANLFTKEQTGVEHGLSLQQQAKGFQDVAQMPSAIQAGISENQLKLSQTQTDKINQLGVMAGQLAGVMDGIQPEKRAEAMDAYLRSNNIDPSQLGVLASGDPDTLRQVSQKMIQASSTFQTQMAVEQQRGLNQANVAGITASGRQQAAEISADARRAVADTNAATRRALAPLQAIEGQLADKVAKGTATPEERKTLQILREQDQLIKSGSPFQSTITGTQTQPNLPQFPTPTGGGGGGGGQTPPEAIPTAVQAAGWEYEPNKYDYRIGPDGSVQRRAK